MFTSVMAKENVATTSLAKQIRFCCSCCLYEQQDLKSGHHLLNVPYAGGKRSGVRFSWPIKQRLISVEGRYKKQEELLVCKEGYLIMDQLVELTSKECGCLLVIDDKLRLVGMFAMVTCGVRSCPMEMTSSSS